MAGVTVFGFWGQVIKWIVALPCSFESPAQRKLAPVLRRSCGELPLKRNRGLPPTASTNTSHMSVSRWKQIFQLQCSLRRAVAQAKVKVKSLSRVQLFVTPWTVAYQDPLSMGFSRQEYWSGLPFPSPGDLPDPGIEPRSPSL